jgi:hypothetical protein
MTDQAVEGSQPVETPEEPQDGAGQTGQSFDADYVEKLRKENARYRTEAKANAEAAKRLAQIEESQKSEQQKLEERATAAEQRAAEFESRLVRAEVATAKGLTPTQAKRLVGTTREELEADADELLKDIGARSASYDGGARTTATTTKDMNRLLREAAGRA